jgi:hypothetical protein
MSVSSTSSSNWSKEVERLLDQIRMNSIELESHHKKKYFAIKKLTVWFRVPVIVLSSINSLAAVSLQSYLAQNLISGLNAGISFLIGIITSIGLYLKVEDKAEEELEASRKYHVLALNIFKILSLKDNDRGVDGDIFLSTCFSEYIKLFEQSGLSDVEFMDKLKIELVVGIENICIKE